MPTIARPSGLVAFAAIATGAGLLLGLSGWLPPHRTIEFCALVLAAILVSATGPRQSSADQMQPAFVLECISLLLFGPHPTMLVAAAGSVAQGLAAPARSHPEARILGNAAAAIVAVQAAGLVFAPLGATGQLAWPWQAAPIAAAAVVYGVARSASSALMALAVTRQGFDRS